MTKNILIFTSLLFLLLLNLAFAQEEATVEDPLSKLDASYAEAVKEGSFENHHIMIRELEPKMSNQYNFLWRAARGYWVVGDFLYWKYTLANIKSNPFDDIDDIFEIEDNLSDQQGADLIKFAKIGWDYAKKATSLNPNGIEGRFYHASSISIYALGKSIVSALKEGLKGKFDKEVDAAIKINSSFLEGCPSTL